MEQLFSTTPLQVGQLVNKIELGELGLPELQRPFIWPDSKVRDLFDSMMKGYPIGYLMLWDCPELDKKKTIGVDEHSYPIVCEGKTEEEIIQMEYENALPHGWERMSYEEFLMARRKLMAEKIKKGYEKLCK